MESVTDWPNQSGLKLLVTVYCFKNHNLKLLMKVFKQYHPVKRKIQVREILVSRRRFNQIIICNNHSWYVQTLLTSCAVKTLENYQICIWHKVVKTVSLIYLIWRRCVTKIVKNWKRLKAFLDCLIH